MKTLFLISCLFVNLLISKPLEVDVNAKSAILINPDNNAILFEKNAFEKAYPASLTKVVTIWYILEKYSKYLENSFESSENALTIVNPEKKISSKYKVPAYVLETDGTSFDILYNERLMLKDMLFGMAVSSGNDAANVAAESLGGSIDDFMKDLNFFLKEKKINNTNLLNPHGLHMPEHTSTAYDLSQVVKNALKNENFLEYFSCRYFIRPKTNKQKPKELITYNKLLKPGENYYKYAIGAKTGYHSKAKYNLVSVAKKNGRTLIAVVMKCDSSDKRYIDTKNLFEKAFEEKIQEKKLVNKDKIFLAKIDGGNQILKAKLKNDFKIKYFPSEYSPLKASIVWENVSLPIKKNQKVGVLNIKTLDGNVAYQEVIYAESNVKKTFFHMIKSWFCG